MAAHLRLEGLDRMYGSVRALDGFTLTLERGEVMCLLGASGCGKTTALRLAAGLERPDGGRVSVGGREVSGPDVFIPPERRGVGLIFQDYALFPHLTVAENVGFGLRHLESGEARRRALAELERVGMEGRAGVYPQHLSGGEQQRVALARALAPSPDVMLMDEPFSGLDRRLRSAVGDEALTVLKATGTTCLMVTHDPDEAMRMGDRIAMMRAGRVVQTGDPGRLWTQPVDKETAIFFSDCNVFPGLVKGGCAETSIGSCPAKDFSDGTPVDVILRPEAFVPGESPESGGCVVSVTVIRSRLLGRDCLIEAEVGGIRLKARPRGGDQGGELPQAGSRVSLCWDPGQALVFAAAESDGASGEGCASVASLP